MGGRSHPQRWFGGWFRPPSQNPVSGKSIFNASQVNSMPAINVDAESNTDGPQLSLLRSLSASVVSENDDDDDKDENEEKLAGHVVGLMQAEGLISLCSSCMTSSTISSFLEHVVVVVELGTDEVGGIVQDG